MSEQVRASHILVKEADECTVLRQALLEDGADFAALARERSLCPSGLQKGGDLGFFGRGQMVPAFEEAAFAQSLGEIGECVATPFGQHLIRVEERR
jgi:parvulin-like peptidyl-prolyl isomerase